MKKENKIDVESCYKIECIKTTEKEVLIHLLKSDVVNAKQVIDSVKKTNSDIDFTDFTFYQII